MSHLSDLLASLVPAHRRTPAQLTNAEIAELLKTTPGALEAFTRSYQSLEAALDAENASRCEKTMNSRQAARARRGAMARGAEAVTSRSTPPSAGGLVVRIVDELSTQLEIALMSHDDLDPVTATEIAVLPEHLRPQLTGSMAVKDIPDDAHPAVLTMLMHAQKLSDPRAAEQARLQALAMLDTFDLDPVLYEMLGRNPAAMSHWFPALDRAVAATGAFLVPETTIRKVPLPILQMSRLSFHELTEPTMEIIDEWVRRAFALDDTKDHFIKTGTFSSKFDFRNAHVPAGQEVREIGQYLTYIQFQANQMAGPLNGRPTVGVSTTNEWVVREWIEDESNSPTIYHGMPLRTEFRVFIDCDEDTVLAVAPYWDPEVMLERFEQHADAEDPDMRHDAIVFRMHLPVLMERFERLKKSVRQRAESLLPHLELTGQWSLDIMANDDAGEQLYAIDMAPASTSALSHHVPAGLLKHEDIDWLPRLG